MLEVISPLSFRVSSELSFLFFLVLPRLSYFSSGWKFTKLEICLLLILSDMTKIDEGVGELIDDVTREEGLDSRTFLRPEYVRVSRTNLK